ncbi:MAG: DUF5305 domain-containing protein [Halorientalis sp.]
MADWRLRLRALLDEQFAVVVGVLVVLALVGGGLTYTSYTQPPTTTEQRPGPSWETAGWFNHSATVTGENPLYPVGTELVDRSVYFGKISPDLDGTYTFTYGASEGGDLNATVSLALVLRGVERTRDNTTVVWQTSRTLGTATDDGLSPGETVRVPFTVDMNRTANRTERIEEGLDNPPGQSEAVVLATVDYDGTVNGRQVDQVREYALPVEMDGTAYRPGDPGRMVQRNESTRTVTVEQSGGPWRLAGPVLLATPLLGLLALGAARWRDALGLSPAERDRLAYEEDRSDFEEWISPIHLPEEAFDLPRARAASLGALVDFAIDTDNGVVEDPDGEAFYVVHDGYLYTYAPPTLDGTGASRNGDASRHEAVGDPDDALDAPVENPAGDGESPDGE